MRGAQPIFLPILPVPAEEVSDSSRALAAFREGTRGVMLESAPEPPDQPEQEPLAFGAFETTQVGDQFSVFPYSAIGKLFMHFPAGDFVGSAWVIGQNAFFTAGHCLFFPDLGGAASTVIFAGRYRQGQFIKKWTVANKAVPNAWKLSKDFTADMGICILSEPIRPLLGKLGFRANASPFSQGPYTEVGYPAEALPNFPFDGEQMWQSVGEFASTPTPIANGVGIIMAGGNLSGGCSGGPWCDAQDQFRAVGLNSGRFVGDTNHMNSPYFGDRFVELLDWMQQNGGDS